ncbi:hypothetical protein J2W32_005971 [Variovorax boronicumulans]|uniref:Ribbon-helix-helix protein CopG domain-containing protein n=1 Tax=Variovorax boronicumulans TaxID=436515 RepID=A0AAW8D932_9BURK|nr:hypothetical protein [Variovorax boronicumulans]MDP9896779.1 hypothetical protein [Variovorax boronicumulans]MDQ0056897.1 hypothetical protein [Variovorax boronicumulans]
MAAEKNVSVSFRGTPKFKSLLELAATREQRSRTNLLERLLFDHCRKQGIAVPIASKLVTHENAGA